MQSTHWYDRTQQCRTLNAREPIAWRTRSMHFCALQSCGSVAILHAKKWCDKCGSVPIGSSLTCRYEVKGSQTESPLVYETRFTRRASVYKTNDGAVEFLGCCDSLHLVRSTSLYKSIHMRDLLGQPQIEVMVKVAPKSIRTVKSSRCSTPFSYMATRPFRSFFGGLITCYC